MEKLFEKFVRPTANRIAAKKVTAEVETITGELALEYLKSNTLNRKLSQRVAEILAGKIERGEWILNGDAISFDYNGKLINGQHRLTAVVLSGMSIKSFVVCGLEPEAFKTYDSPKRRMLSDAIDIAGGGQVKNSKILQAVATHLFRHDIRFNLFSQSAEDFPSVDEAFAIMARYPHMADSLEFVSKDRHLWFLPLGVATALHLLFSKFDADLADVFFNSIKAGTNMEDGSAILAFRDYLIKSYKPRESRDRMTLMATTVKAWNYWMQDRTVRLMSWRLSEGWPQIYGVDRLDE